jgi:hypothetical protein
LRLAIVDVARKAWFVDRRIAGSGGELERKNGVEVAFAEGNARVKMGAAISGNW